MLLHKPDVYNGRVYLVIVGDGQWGSVHVFDLNTQALNWRSITQTTVSRTLQLAM